MSNHHSLTPFDNIESSHEYVSLLAIAVEEALAEVDADIHAGLGIASRSPQGGFATGAFPSA